MIVNNYTGWPLRFQVLFYNCFQYFQGFEALVHIPGQIFSGDSDKLFHYLILDNKGVQLFHRRRDDILQCIGGRRQ